MSALFQHHLKTIATAGPVEPIGPPDLLFNVGILVAMRTESEPSSGIVRFRPVGSSGWRQIYPGVADTLSAPVSGIFKASDFELRVDIPGDGVVLEYVLATRDSFSDLESKLEEAVLRYLRTVAVVLDDVSFTAGITAEERTADNVNIYAETGTEAVRGSRGFLMTVRIEVRTAVGKGDQLERHRLRTAYVRDLILEPNAEGIISSLSPSLTVAPRSIRDVEISQRIEGKQWISDIGCRLLAWGSDLVG